MSDLPTREEMKAAWKALADAAQDMKDSMGQLGEKLEAARADVNRLRELLEKK